jgi:hypothetical protein
MTDMHREGFEKYAMRRKLSVVRCANGPYVWDDTELAWLIWQAALRYRDEQEKPA